MELRFRLPVHKLKCKECQLIFMVEHSNFATMTGFTCPSCGDSNGDHVEHMEDIVIVEESKTDEKTQKLIDGMIALPKSDLYVFRGDLSREETEHVKRLWDAIRRERGFEDAKLFIMPDSIHVGTTTKEDLKRHITDILERM